MSFLKEFSGHPEYQRLLNQAKAQRPVVPAWTPAEGNVEEWKDASAMQRGFDLALQIFTPK